MDIISFIIFLMVAVAIGYCIYNYFATKMETRRLSKLTNMPIPPQAVVIPTVDNKPTTLVIIPPEAKPAVVVVPDLPPTPPATPVDVIPFVLPVDEFALTKAPEVTTDDSGATDRAVLDTGNAAEGTLFEEPSPDNATTGQASEAHFWGYDRGNQTGNAAEGPLTAPTPHETPATHSESVSAPYSPPASDYGSSSYSSDSGSSSSYDSGSSSSSDSGSSSSSSD